MEEPRKQLKLFQELKDESIHLVNDTIEDLESKAEIFDINPNTNYQLIKLYLENKNNDNFTTFYLNKIQTLCFDQKKEIIEKINQDENKEIKTGILNWININDKSFFKSYFLILKELLKIYREYKNDEDINIVEIENLFKKEFYVDNNSIKIPLIYGCTELKYAGLINNLYHHLLIRKNNEKGEKEGKLSYENKFYGYDKYPKDIMEKKKEHQNKEQENPENKMIVEDENVDVEENENINEDEDDDKDENEVTSKCNITSKLEFMSKYLEKINSQEFYDFFDLKKKFESNDSENFDRDYKVKTNIDSLFFHLLYFDLIICLYSFNQDSNYLTSYEENFFEKKLKKQNFLIELQKKGFIFYDNNNKKIKFKKKDDVKSQLYKIYDKNKNNNYIEFNPYDYSLSKMGKDLRKIKYNFETLMKKFKKPKYFSLFKIYKNQIIFKDEQLSELFKANIKDMLCSKTTKELFYQFVNYKDYEYPYIGQNKDKFLSQTFDIVINYPIPFKDIGGFTYKNFGIIFINNIGQIENKQFIKESTSFIYKLCQISFKKIVYFHEIIPHYSSVLIHANKKEIELSTPDNTFIEDYPKDSYIEIYSSFDGGEKGESLLLGNIIKYIYIKGAIFLLNRKSWEMNLNEFKNNFIRENEVKDHDFLDIIQETKTNEFIKYYKENNDNDIFKKENVVFTINRQNSLFCFRESKEEVGSDILVEDGIMFWDRMSHKGKMIFDTSPFKNSIS